MKDMIRRLLWALVAGVAAGLAAFLVDLGFARWVLGFPLILHGYFVGWYLLVGGVFGLVLGSVRALRGGPDRGALWSHWGLHWATCFYAMWLPGVAERLQHRFGREDLTRAVAVVVSAALAYCIAGWICRRFAGGPGLVLGGLSWALALAVHRNVLDDDLSARGLLLDGLIALAAVAIACAVRWREQGGDGAHQRTAWIAVSLALAAVCIGVLVTQVSPRDDVQRVTTPPEGAPNVIFVVVDTLRWSVFRDVVDTTPEGAEFLEAFGPAVDFDRMTAIAPWTAPSVASIFTGRYPSAHGYGAKHTGDVDRPIRRLDPSVPTLAQLLRNRGYSTRAWVTNPILYPATGIARGFDSYELLQATTIKLPLLNALREMQWVPMDLYQPADALRKRLQGGLDGLENSQPFFLWLHAMDPHSPLYERPELQPATDPRGRQLGEQESMYYGEVRFVLSELTKMIRMLRERGLWDQSLRVFVADHGEMFPEDGHETGTMNRDGGKKTYGHGHGLYDELVRVPLLISPPAGLERSRRVDALASHVDLYATVSDVLGQTAGLELPQLEGERYSLARWWRAEGAADVNEDDQAGGETEAGAGDEPAWREAALSGFLQHRPKQRALVGQRLKIIDFMDLRVEVYDIEADPREQQDLSESHPETVTQGMLLLEQYWRAVKSAESDDAGGVEIDEETRRKLEALGYL